MVVMLNTMRYGIAISARSCAEGDDDETIAATTPILIADRSFLVAKEEATFSR